MEWPINFNRPSCGAQLVLYQPFEFGVIPAAWVSAIHENVTEIWVPSTYCQTVFVASGVPLDKVHIVPHGVRILDLLPLHPPLRLRTNKSFKFLYRGGLLPRKGIDVLLRAFTATFSRRDDVVLIIHSSYGDFMKKEIALLSQSSDMDVPEIEAYMDSRMSISELSSLHAATDCLVCPFRSEGFGLIILEAMASFLPVIATRYGGPLAFLTSANSYQIPAGSANCHLPPCGPTEVFGSKTLEQPTWAEPDTVALSNILRHIVKAPEERRQKALEAFKTAKEWSWDRSAVSALRRLRHLADLGYSLQEELK